MWLLWIAATVGLGLTIVGLIFVTDEDWLDHGKTLITKLG